MTTPTIDAPPVGLSPARRHDDHEPSTPALGDPVDAVDSRPASVRSRSRMLGGLFGLVSAAAWAAWLSWRVATLTFELVAILAVALELLGAASGVIISLAMWRSRHPRRVWSVGCVDGCRFAFGVADVVGRTRAADLHRDVRDAVRAARHNLRRALPEYATAAVLLDGPRRLALMALATLGLLVGQSPLPALHWPALAALALAMVTTSGAHALLAGGRVRIGDRIRWSFSSLGEVFVRDDITGVAPRRWVGTMGAIVVVNLAIALRGISDRWTHGLPAMDDDQRMIAMLLALTIVTGGIYTMATMASPDLPNAHLVARRIEERTARQSALGGALCFGIVGLLAGILPGADEPARPTDRPRVELVAELDLLRGG